MAKTEGEVNDAEFRATFSLLPYVLRLSRVLSSGQTDPQATQKIVSSHPRDLPHSSHQNKFNCWYTSERIALRIQSTPHMAWG